MSKSTFAFHKEWSDALSGLPDDVRLDVYEAIIGYAFSDVIPDLAPLPMAIFLSVKDVIDKDKATSEKRREAGKRKKAGKKVVRRTVRRKTLPAKKNEEDPPPEPSPPPEEKPVIVEKNKQEEPPNVPPPPPIERRQLKFYDSLVPFVEKYGREMVREFYNYWSEYNRSGTKMRFELQPTWVTSKRLARWNLQSKPIQHESTSNPETRAREAADIIASLAADEWQ